MLDVSLNRFSIIQYLLLKVLISLGAARTSKTKQTSPRLAAVFYAFCVSRCKAPCLLKSRPGNCPIKCGRSGNGCFLRFPLQADIFQEGGRCNWQPKVFSSGSRLDRWRLMLKVWSLPECRAHRLRRCFDRRKKSAFGTGNFGVSLGQIDFLLVKWKAFLIPN